MSTPNCCEKEHEGIFGGKKLSYSKLTFRNKNRDYDFKMIGTSV